MKLSQKEEELMDIIWRLNSAYMKDILDELPEPKPATTTIATLLKRMLEKGAIGFNLNGNSRQYFAKIDKNEYSTSYLRNMISTFFQGSSRRFASFFTNDMSLSKEELLELRDMIDDKLKSSES